MLWLIFLFTPFIFCLHFTAKGDHCVRNEDFFLDCHGSISVLLYILAASFTDISELLTNLFLNFGIVIQLNLKAFDLIVKWIKAHEAISLFGLRKLILQMGMHNHPVGLVVWFLVWPFVYFHILCVRTVKALVRLRGCASSPEPSLVAYVISTIISWAGSLE